MAIKWKDYWETHATNMKKALKIKRFTKSGTMLVPPLWLSASTARRKINISHYTGVALCTAEINILSWILLVQLWISGSSSG